MTKFKLPGGGSYDECLEVAKKVAHEFRKQA